MKRLCTICARGASKGVKNKNLRILLGRPLIAHTVEQAKSSQLFDTIAVSSDSREILSTAAEYGADELVVRPPDLAGDDAPKLPAIHHCVQTVEARLDVTFDTLVDLDATSPLRDLADITTTVRLLEQSDAANILTGTPSRKSPYFNMVEVLDTGVTRLVKQSGKEIVRRQDVPLTFDLNASIYVWKRSQFLTDFTLFTDKTRLYVMPPERSVDIDSELDFEWVEFLMKRRRSQA
ncbi:cytidylyltransferase domain-containing protein [Alicyclobacillus sp. SO9]|uniref:acylneuraminate cytidylyltransferase family protein n=1 Tax=Alicyclobacillus sp. SO9 TaxID=2665646 RepID=UPI0018E79792|nr:acylneuraminate cytidylyltransferase family protein [Alicyclobacillus sp. SO9]QQE81444.1 acylneuraminate cytidylyltransferase family protein [Alicyclobacillus sp. SO9]